MTRIAAFVLVVASGVAFADPVLDQSFAPALPTGTAAQIGIGNLVDWSQTFTVGITGTLTSFQVAVRTGGTATLPLLVDLRTTTVTGAPTEPDSGASILVSTSISGIGGGAFTVLDIAAGVPVAAGDILAIVLRSSDPASPGVYQWAGATTGGYAGGSSFVRLSGTWGGSTSIPELWFQTFVDAGTTNVPEPATLALLGTGLALVWVVRQSRRDATDSR